MNLTSGKANVSEKTRVIKLVRKNAAEIFSRRRFVGGIVYEFPNKDSTVG